MSWYYPPKKPSKRSPAFKLEINKYDDEFWYRFYFKVNDPKNFALKNKANVDRIIWTGLGRCVLKRMILSGDARASEMGIWDIFPSPMAVFHFHPFLQEQHSEETLAFLFVRDFAFNITHAVLSEDIWTFPDIEYLGYCYDFEITGSKWSSYEYLNS